MKEIMKEKTTIIALIGAGGFIALLVMLIMKILTAAEFSLAIGSWAGAIVTGIGWCAADRNKPQP